MSAQAPSHQCCTEEPGRSSVKSLHSTDISIDTSCFNNSTDTTGTSLHSKYENDLLYELLIHNYAVVMNPDPKWRPLYMKRFFEIGNKDRIMQLASIAKADSQTNPARYFSTLLKNETKTKRTNLRGAVDRLAHSKSIN